MFISPFSNLSELNFITIYLYREADFHKESSKRRKPSTSQNQLIGVCVFLSFIGKTQRQFKAV